MKKIFCDSCKEEIIGVIEKARILNQDRELCFDCNVKWENLQKGFLNKNNPIHVFIEQDSEEVCQPKKPRRRPLKSILLQKIK